MDMTTVIIFGALLWIITDNTTTNRKIDVLHRKLHLICEHLEIEDNQHQRAVEKVKRALRQDRPITALKILRKATGMGLKDAKERIERYQREMDAEDGE